MSEKILANATDFIGRNAEVEKILRRAGSDNEKRGFLMLSAPAAGATELLKQLYDKIFREQGELIPVYFSIKTADKTAEKCAVRFLRNFLAQTIAFRRRNSQISDASPDLREIIELAAPEDKDWIEPLVRILENKNTAGDESFFVKTCLSAPLRANASGAKTFVLIDDLDEAARLSGEADFVAGLKEIVDRSTAPFVLAGKRRFMLNNGENALLTNAETMRVNALDFNAAGTLIENLAARFAVEINEQTRDLISAQFGGKPLFIKFLFEAASEKKSALDSFQRVEKIYAEEIFGGRTKAFYDAIFRRAAPDFTVQKSIVELLYNALNEDAEKQPLEIWKEKLGADDADFQTTIEFLHTQEIVRLASNFVEPMRENEILSDYVAARFRLEIKSETRALVVGEMLSQFIKRAPQLMAKIYRQDSAVNLRALLGTFDAEDAPAALLDYSIFRERFKGLSETEIFAQIAGGAEKIRLPQIVYTARTSAFYPPIQKVVEPERSAIALGFAEGKYTAEDEIVWLAAEIDSKLEAGRESAEFWCDRLEMVALNCNFTNYKIWLVAPEGFKNEASEVLKQRNAVGSSRAQIDLLAKFLDAENLIGKKSAPNEYEIVVPMGEDTELIAAHTIEDIARRFAFDSKAINQIKTALVEACINATEHSLSPDRKIYQKFTVEPDKITIKISNRGLRIADKNAAEIVPNEGRRGWGLKLMQSLMDEVKFEQVDDGTRISMTKYFQKS